MPVAPLERDMIKKLDDLMRASERSGHITHTVFLDSATASSALAYASNRYDGGCLLFGGYPAAERSVLFFLNGFAPDEVGFSEYISLISITLADKKTSFTHRDYLGSLMALQISRDRLGDIIVLEGCAQVFALPPADIFLMQNLERISTTTVSLEVLPLESAATPSEKGETVVVSVSSLRLDCVCAAAFHLSRSTAAEHIASGRVSVNWRLVEKPDYITAEGDMLGLRGMGRARLDKIGGRSKKGRIFITLEIM